MKFSSKKDLLIIKKVSSKIGNCNRNELNLDNENSTKVFLDSQIMFNRKISQKQDRIADDFLISQEYKTTIFIRS